jgi:DNA polymerase II small subunit
MTMTKEQAVRLLLEQGVLVGPDLLERLDEETLERLTPLLEDADPTVLTSDVEKLLESGKSDINWHEFENGRVQKEKGTSSALYNRFLDFVSTDEKRPEAAQPAVIGGLRVVRTYDKPSTKRSVQDFVAYYNNRYRALERILASRQEMQNLTSISRILAKRDREGVAVIGLVQSVNSTKKGNLMLTLEDLTGEIRVVISKSKPELFRQAKDIVPDEVIGVSGVNGDRIIFANNVIWPDVPLMNEKKTSSDEAYAVFLSDLHVGSNNFLPKELERFLSWISGEAGSEKQKEIASKVKYVFVIGDLVDGVGIYPGQESELVIPDIYKQYEKVTEYLSKIPSSIPLIICPGNHDTGRIAEPQLSLGKGFSKALSSLPNATLVSNPSLVNIHASEEFSGFDVLLYHGYSFDSYVANVDSIRTQGGYDRADLIMKFLLQRRHLAPTQGSTLYIPDVDTDPLVVDSVPDFLITGHIHKCSVSSYRGVTLICGSCWQSTTDFQKKVGHHPEPARVPIVNLQTREVKILRF